MKHIARKLLVIRQIIQKEYRLFWRNGNLCLRGTNNKSQKQTGAENSLHNQVIPSASN
jgi:hypothetical protein